MPRLPLPNAVREVMQPTRFEFVPNLKAPMRSGLLSRLHSLFALTILFAAVDESGFVLVFGVRRETGKE